jgi:hypothetical protein
MKSSFNNSTISWEAFLAISNTLAPPLAPGEWLAKALAFLEKLLHGYTNQIYFLKAVL